MKRKLILGLLAVMSVFALAQVKNATENSGRKFWGSECQQVGKTSETWECCYYVFWINTGCKLEDREHQEDGGN